MNSACLQINMSSTFFYPKGEHQYFTLLLFCTVMRMKRIYLLVKPLLKYFWWMSEGEVSNKNKAKTKINIPRQLIKWRSQVTRWMVVKAG